MPYINKAERPKFDYHVGRIADDILKAPVDVQDGYLNYVITSLLLKIYTPKYFNYNRALGVLEAAKLEFYRRRVAPYEDAAKERNGDVFD